MSNKLKIFAVALLVLLLALEIPTVAALSFGDLQDPGEERRKRERVREKLEEAIDELRSLEEEAEAEEVEKALGEAREHFKRVRESLKNLEKVHKRLEERFKKIAERVAERKGKLEANLTRALEAIERAMEIIRKSPERARELAENASKIAREVRCLAKAEERLSELYEELETFGLKVARERIEYLRGVIEERHERLLREVGEELEGLKIDVKNAVVRGPRSEVKLNLRLPELAFKWLSPAEVEYKFKAKAIKIVEFVDTNNDTQVDEGEIVQRLHLKDVAWKIKSEAIVDPETNETSYRATYECEIYGARIRVVTYVCQLSKELTDGAAEEAKLTFVIENWPWKRDDSMLAVYVTPEVEVKGPTLPIPKTIELFGEQGFYIELPEEAYIKFDWSRNITVDGRIESVVNVYIEKAELKAEEGKYEAEYEIALVYPHGAAIEHDPGVGVEDDPGEAIIIREIGAKAPILMPVMPTDLAFLTSALFTMLALCAVATLLVILAVRRIRGIPAPAAIRG